MVQGALALAHRNDWANRLTSRETKAGFTVNRGCSNPRLYLCDGCDHQLGHLGADLVFAECDALGVKIGHDLFDDASPRAVDLRRDDIPGIGIGVATALAELFGNPEAEEPVAPRLRLELQLFVMDELLLESLLALVERRHGKGARAWTNR